MPALTCSVCNAEFKEEVAQKAHYKSKWHRHNIKRKASGVPGVTEALFQTRQQALDEEHKVLESKQMLYRCALCGKKYESAEAHAQHLNSSAHTLRASETPDSPSAGIGVIKPLPEEGAGGNFESIAEKLEWDPSRCFICDVRPDGTIESCVEHMHKIHGFFIPNVEYLKDPRGLLTYLGLKVTNDFICLYCNERRRPFRSVEAVRKHMISKNHCKLHYGNGDEEEDSDLDEFYDYNFSVLEHESGIQIVPTDGSLELELGLGGSELVIQRKSEKGTSSKILGSREFLRYYRQRPRPAAERDICLSHALVSRYRSLCLATVQSKEKMLTRKLLNKIRSSGVEEMRTKVALKNNAIRNLPRNVPRRSFPRNV